jgi:protein-S-isoprenylcysteine O-methyltransferase Ste14
MTTVDLIRYRPPRIAMSLVLVAVAAHLQEFGNEYDEYKRRVPRWI